MIDPFAVLGLPPETDDAAIRRRYLELIKQCTPEQSPERFAEVRAAYEAVRTAEARVQFRLFEKGHTPKGNIRGSVADRIATAQWN